MHTFSPARMWIADMRMLDKPLLHLHTQFNEELPWSLLVLGGLVFCVRSRPTAAPGK